MPSSTLFTRTMGRNGIICSSTTNGCRGVGFGKEQLRAGGHVHARGLRQHRRVFADEIPVQRSVRATAALRLP